MSERVQQLASQHQEESPEDRRIRVLVVDDEDSVRAAVIALLDHHGSFRVVAEASDGAFAPALVRKLEPDVVLIDLRMPIVGGIDALQLIRAVDPRVEIVMLSAYSDQALISDALAAGAFAYVIKGSPAEELFETLERAWRNDADSRSERDA
jgi:DNA-binding NarL/FixJ family response regulator